MSSYGRPKGGGIAKQVKTKHFTELPKRKPPVRKKAKKMNSSYPLLWPREMGFKW
jgi:hypothetical protein